MKMHGKAIVKPNIELIVLPRDDGPLVFKAKGITDGSDFDKLCPLPEPPTKIFPGGKKVQDVEAPEYKAKLLERNQLQFHYMVLKSLEATEGLEWDTVNLSDSSTWKNYADELLAAGLNNMEVNRIVQGVLDANSLNEDKIEEARQRFLASQQAQLEG